MGTGTSEGDLLLYPIDEKYTNWNMFLRMCSRIVANDLGMVVTMGLHWGNCESLNNFTSWMQGLRKGKGKSEETYSYIL